MHQYSITLVLSNRDCATIGEISVVVSATDDYCASLMANSLALGFGPDVLVSTYWEEL